MRPYSHQRVEQRSLQRPMHGRQSICFVDRERSTTGALRSGWLGYYMKYCEINYQHPCRCLADAITNLGGWSEAIKWAHLHSGRHRSPFVSGTGSVELLGQIVFAIVVRIQAACRHCCHLSRSAEESRRTATPLRLVPSPCTKLPLFSEMRRIS